MNSIKWIVLSGTSGTGKTTLVSKLEKELKSRGKIVEVVNEVARSSPWAINEQADFIGQRWIFHQQILTELEAEFKHPNVILCDRGICDNLAYFERLHNPHEPFPITEYLQLFEIARYWSQRYDYIIHMPFNSSWLKDDGVRSTNKIFTREIDLKINKITKEFGLKTLKYRKNFNISEFCDKFAPPQKKLRKVTVRKRNNKSQ